MNDVRIATRRSALALWQANTVSSLLTEKGYETTLVPLVTTGDRMQKGALADVTMSAAEAHLRTGKGLFVKEIQESMLRGESNLAVHSMKDLPVAQTRGLVLAGVLPRAAIEDVLIFSPVVRQALLSAATDDERARVAQDPLGLQILPYARMRSLLAVCDAFLEHEIGTTSARRQALLKREFSPALNTVVLRGNVDTRLGRVARSEFGAILLARAGLERLDLYEKGTMYFLPADVFIPAPAQGIIALESPDRESQVREAVARISCRKTALAAALERLALWMLGGDCHTAIGASWQSPMLHVFCATENGQWEIAFEAESKHVEELEVVCERERGFYHGLFETLKGTSFARSLYGALSTAGFETLVPWGG